MPELKIYLSDSLNEKFRRIAMSVHGYGRGSLSKAAEEAFTKWCSEHEPSTAPKGIVGHSEIIKHESSTEAGSHNPDERVNVDQEMKRLGGNQTPSPTGLGT